MSGVFADAQGAPLRGLVVWLPMVAGDSVRAADEQRNKLGDSRITGWWDGDREIGLGLTRVLKLTRKVAWDVYLVYGAGAVWSGDRLPAPDFWMHQLQKEDPKRFLKAARLREVVKDLLGRRAQ